MKGYGKKGGKKPAKEKTGKYAKPC